MGKLARLFTIFAMLLPLQVAAQQYPARAIKFIVPFPPGGGVDIVARALGEKLSPRLGQPVVIDNKPGAGTTIGTDAAVKSAPDGYTFLVSGIGSQAIVHLMFAKLSFDIRRDLAPVSRVGYGTIVLVVPQASPARTVQDLVAIARSKPGQLTFGSSGTGAIIHLTTEMFRQAAGIELTHVPYKGTTQILPDLLAGRVDMALDSVPAYLPHLESGKLRALAVASARRSPLLPQLPTMAEAGYPGVVSATDYAVYAPAGTPNEIVARLNREINTVLQLDDVRAKLAAQGISISGSTPEALRAELLEELDKWAKVIHEADLKPQ
jgi:tripartite-type tricarboxylate transporter receptor subunit TctC